MRIGVKNSANLIPFDATANRLLRRSFLYLRLENGFLTTKLKKSAYN
jgi:hypothetical protein